MGITVSFIFCLLSGFACFWLFWKCVEKCPFGALSFEEREN